MISLLGIVGSLRKGSFNASLLRAYGEVLPADVRLTVFEGLGELPHFNDDVLAAGVPPSVAAFKKAIEDSTALIVASPEYNFSVPGVLKNAIDWASRPPATSPLRGKPVGIIGASSGPSGTMRGQYHLRQVFCGTDSLVLSRPEIFVPKAATVFDANGVLTDATIRENLKKHAEALVAWATRLGAHEKKAGS